MQNRFKFRAYDFEQEKMLYNIFLSDEGKPVICSDDGKLFYGQLNCCEIMQCTGRTDCTGKLIYENDILSVTGKNGVKFTYIVTYSNTEYKWILIYNYSYLKGKKARDFHKQYAEPKCLYKEGYRVIGNIYEDKELLESEE